MSRISDVRSRTLQLKIFSRLRLCAGERSSSKITVSTSCRRQKSANSSALPLPMNVAGDSDSIFWIPVSMTSPPAVSVSSPSSASESRREVGPSSCLSGRLEACPTRDLSSTPTRKTRSGRVFLFSMRDFNGYDVSNLGITARRKIPPAKPRPVWRAPQSALRDFPVHRNHATPFAFRCDFLQHHMAAALTVNKEPEPLHQLR